MPDDEKWVQPSMIGPDGQPTQETRPEEGQLTEEDESARPEPLEELVTSPVENDSPSHSTAADNEAHLVRRLEMLETLDDNGNLPPAAFAELNRLREHFNPHFEPAEETKQEAQESKSIRDVTETVFHFLGIRIDKFLENVQTYLEEVVETIEDDNVKNTIRRSEIVKSAKAVLDADSIVLNDGTKIILENIIELDKNNREKVLKQTQKHEQERDKETYKPKY